MLEPQSKPDVFNFGPDIPFYFVRFKDTASNIEMRDTATKNIIAIINSDDIKRTMDTEFLTKVLEDRFSRFYDIYNHYVTELVKGKQK